MNEIANTIPIQVYLSNNVPVVTSRNVAEYFHKRHDRVLKDIDNLISEINEVATQSPILETDTADYSSKLSATTKDFPPILGVTHFKEISYIASNGKPNREFEMTKDGFTLLATGFTGKEALKWKLKYVEAFNRIEKILSRVNHFHFNDSQAFTSGRCAYTIDSREVAEMVGKKHSELLKDIRRYIEQFNEVNIPSVDCEQLGLGNIPQSDFFTESSYKKQSEQNNALLQSHQGRM